MLLRRFCRACIIAIRGYDFHEGQVRVRDIHDLTRLQMEFIQAQMQALTEQAKDLSETAIKAMTDSAKNPTKGGPSS